MALIDYEEFKEVEESLHFALEVADLGSWEYEVESGAIKGSQRFNQIFGYKGLSTHWSVEDLLAHVHPGDRENFSAQLEATVKDRKDLAFECRIFANDGKEKWLSFLGKPHFDSSGAIHRISGLVSNITSEKLAAHKLQTAMLAAEDAFREKAYFLANMSHEIRTPLGTILGFTEMLKKSNLSEGDRNEYLDVIAQSGKNLTNLIDHILDLSKIDAGSLEIEETAVDLQQLLDEIKLLLEPQAFYKGIDFKFSMEPKINQKIKTDAIRLRQVLLNIIGNAIKFTKNGSVEVHTKISKASDDRFKIVFKVTDTGVGLDFEEAERVFNPFTQVDNSTTRKYGGTGLGLALSKRLALALGGDLYLERSRKGEGSTFVVEISATVVAQEEEHAFTIPYRNTEPIDLQGTQILVADDSPENQTLFKILLSRMGASVDLVDNGARALEKMSDHEYDVVLMDMQMPELDGYEATREIRRRGDNIPVIALTAHAMRHDRKKCLDCGCSDYISKPVDPVQLYSAIDNARNSQH